MMNLRIGRISWLFAPNYGACERCHTTWKFVPFHCTLEGMFCLCEKCWNDLVPATRLPYYRKVWEKWNDSSDSLYDIIDIPAWEPIETAVEKGL